MLRSTLCTVSAPATYPLRGSITHPTQPLCTLRGRRRRRLTQHSLPGCLLCITWVGLSPTDRASFAWRLRRVGPIPAINAPFTATAAAASASANAQWSPAEVIPPERHDFLAPNEGGPKTGLFRRPTEVGLASGRRDSALWIGRIWGGTTQ